MEIRDLSDMEMTIQPNVLAGILGLNEAEYSSFGQLENIIKADPQMTGFILKAANSSLYSRGQEIGTLKHAIGLLGYRIVRALAVMCGSRSIFHSGNYSRFRRLVWRHSVVTAIIARKLAEIKGMKDLLEESFIAGLLHDTGKVVLNSMDRKKFITVINRATDQERSFADVETDVFGVNHLQIGERIMEDWNLPEIYHPILTNHRNGESLLAGNLSDRERLLLILVAYANFLAKRYGYGHYVLTDENDSALFKDSLGFSRTDIEYCERTYPRQIEQDEFFRFFITML